MTTAEQIVTRAANASKKGVFWEVGMCLKFSRTCAGAAGGVKSAAVAWKNAEYKHTTGLPPRGSFVFWLGGSRGYGHVAISDGGGYVWSTDLKRPGKVDRVPIAYVTAKWPSQKYVGWSEDVNKVRIAGLAPASAKERVHVVRQGDTLWDIAESVYGDGQLWQKIARLNGLKDGDDLAIGFRLRLP